MTFIADFFGEHYFTVARYIFVLLAILIFIQLKRRMLYRANSGYILAVLDIDDGATRLPIMHYETTIGRSNACDVVLPLESISRQHAVLTMTEDGRFRISDTKSKTGIFVNGQVLEKDMIISIGDEIEIAGVKMSLMPATSYDAKVAKRKSSMIAKKNKNIITRIGKILSSKSKKRHKGYLTIFLLNIFQIFAYIGLMITADSKHYIQITAAFVFIFVLPWIYSIIAPVLKIKNISAELAAFFLTTLGICATASTRPASLVKEIGAIVLGMAIFIVMSVILKNLDLVMKLRLYSGVLSLLILGVNIVLGSTINGQKNWINLGFMTVQPSEFVKILFIFTGAATLEWLLTARNLTMLILYSSSCIGLLFLLGDFGTALIYFVTFIVLIFMTSGDVRAIIITGVTAALGGLMVLSYKPYIVNRFSAWRHVWQYADKSGFQQTRALMAIASGGMLGLGAGKGFCKNINAADTDLVMAVISEEWGLIIAALAAGVYVLFLISAIRSHKTARSSYYIIAACTAATLFLFQASLNIFGTVDILPLTGVTLPFISNGGSSLAASFGLLSFITAALNNVRPKIDPTLDPVMLGDQR